MRASSIACGMTALPAMCVLLWCAGVVAQEKPINSELPQRSEISGITPEVLVRTNVPGAPGKIEIVSRTTYQPGPNSAAIITRRRSYFIFLRARWAFKKMEGSRWR
jgi:hypothetical protein